MSKNAILPVALLFVLCSCKTAEFGYTVIDLNGMVYDFANKPVPNYLVTVGEKNVSVTDINGRFVMEKIALGVYPIKGEKEGFEPFAETLDIFDRGQIVYIRVPSSGQLLELADVALSKNRLDEAEAYLKRAWDIGDITAELLMYYAAVKFRQGLYDEAIVRLQSAVNRGSQDRYIEKFLDYLLEKKSRENEN
ncbi:MAG: hypothetical protein LBL44_01555 [Treponema sp.]|nr:hypothetical protein [Treponema sp.]